MSKKYIKETLLGLSALIAALAVGCVIWGGDPEDKLPYHNFNDLFVSAVGQPIFVPIETITANVSAYNPVPEQTDDTPDITASGKQVKEGMIANNCLEFGTIVEMDGKFYEVQDKMNKKYGCNYFDVLMFSKEEAIKFGRQNKIITLYQ